MTATLYGNLVWKGLASEKPSISAADGQFYMELDTGDVYFHRNGAWEYSEAGLSFIKATKSGIVTTDANGLYNVVFETPFVDASYTVALTIQNGEVTPGIAGFSDIAATGFTIHTRDSRSGQSKGNTVVSWLATRNYNP